MKGSTAERCRICSEWVIGSIACKKVVCAAGVTHACAPCACTRVAPNLCFALVLLMSTSPPQSFFFREHAEQRVLAADVTCSDNTNLASEAGINVPASCAVSTGGSIEGCSRRNLSLRLGMVTNEGFVLWSRWPRVRCANDLYWTRMSPTSLRRFRQMADSHTA